MGVGTVAVSVVDLAFDDPAVATLLDAVEAARAQRLVRPDDRLRFGRARTAFKAVLAEATGTMAGDIAVVQRCRRCGGPHGRPSVAVADRAGLRYSLAHAGDLAAVAVADGGEVGVDIEVPLPTSLPDLACTEDERLRLGRLDPAAAAEVFFRLWVRKEAYAKALGEGLELPFDQIRLTGRAGPGAIATAPGHPPLGLSDFVVDGNPLAVAAAPGHVATLRRYRLAGDGPLARTG